MNKDYSDKHYAPRLHEKMKDVLMDMGAKGPKIHYHMVRGGSDQKNITIWEPGLVGEEYVKTYGHYHVGKLDETYWVIYGEGIALVQKRKEDENKNPIDNEIEKVYAVYVKPGDTIYMPPEYGHLLVNISKTYFVTVDDSIVDFDEKNPVSMPGHADYEPVKALQGFCYYIVEEDGKPKLVKNKKYTKVPETEIKSIYSYPFKK